MVEVLWKTEKKKNSAKKLKQHKRATIAELRREEEREALSAKHVPLSFDEAEEKRVRLVGTSMFFFANLEGLARFSYNLNM